MNHDSIPAWLACSCLVQKVLCIMASVSAWRRHLVNLWNWSPVLFKTHFHSKITFKSSQIFRVDILGSNNKFLHFNSYATFNLELLDILNISINRVFLEEVSDKYVLNIWSLIAKSGHHITFAINWRMSATSEIPLSVWLTKRKSLCNVHFS